MNATTHKIPGFPFSVTSEDVSDILCSAFEGGATYWLRHVEVDWKRKVDGERVKAEYASDVPSLGGRLILSYDDPGQEEGNGNGRFTLGLDDVLRGIGLMLAFKDGTRFSMADVNGDNADASTADVILQFAVLGDIVYG